MKKTIIVLITAASFLSVKGQNKSDTTFTDSTEYISNKKINKYLDGLQDRVTARQYNTFLQLMQELAAASRKDWEDKKRKK